MSEEPLLLLPTRIFVGLPSSADSLREHADREPACLVEGGLGCGAWVLGFGFWGLGVGIWGLGFGVWGLRSGF